MLHSQKIYLIINVLYLKNAAYTSASRINHHLKTVLAEDKPAPAHSQGQALRVPSKKFILSIDLSCKTFLPQTLTLPIPRLD